MSGEAPEEWAPVAWPDHYEASTDGRVRNSRTGRILKCRSNGEKGYRKVWLGRSRDEYVHVLVLEAFYGVRPVDADGIPFEGHHRDFDRANNRLDNLEWLPMHENQALRAANA